MKGAGIQTIKKRWKKLRWRKKNKRKRVIEEMRKGLRERLLMNRNNSNTKKASPEFSPRPRSASHKYNVDKHINPETKPPSYASIASKSSPHYVNVTSHNVRRKEPSYASITNQSNPHYVNIDGNINKEKPPSYASITNQSSPQNKQKNEKIIYISSPGSKSKSKSNLVTNPNDVYAVVNKNRTYRNLYDENGARYIHVEEAF